MPQASGRFPVGRSNLPGHSDELRLVDLWLTRPMQWGIAVGAAVVGLILAIIFTMLAPTRYTAQATLKLNATVSGIGLRDFSGAPTQTGTGPEFVLDLLTLQDILTSTSTIETVIDRCKLLDTRGFSDAPSANGASCSAAMPKRSIVDAPASTRDRAIALFRSRIRVEQVKNTRLLQVSYTDPDPVQAAAIANAVVQAYFDNSSRVRLQENKAASQSLNDQLAQLQANVEANHEHVNALQDKAGLTGGAPVLSTNTSGANSFSPDANDSPAYQRLKALEAELTRVEIVRIGREAVYKAMKDATPDQVAQIAGAHLQENDNPANIVASATRSLQLIQRLRSDEATLRLNLAHDRVLYGPSNPIVVQADNQIDSIASQISKETNEIRKDAQTEYDLAVSEEADIRSSVGAQRARVSQLGENISELALAQQQENANRELYQTLSARLHEANVQANVQSSDTSIVAYAEPPSSPSSPILRNNLLVGVVAGFLLGYLIALLLKLSSVPTAMITEETVIAQ